MKQAFFILSLLFLAGCEKEIDLKLDDKSGDIVIEGSVTDQAGPYYVRITRSVAFTESNRFPAVTDAAVVISDDAGQTDTLAYEADGRYRTTGLVSESGRVYTLHVSWQGTTYTASSRLPERVPFERLDPDSIMFAGTPSYGVLPVFTDPPVQGNYYRFIQYVNGERSGSYQLFSDFANNGMVNGRPIFSGSIEITKGDTVTLDMECLDAPVYTYYTALSQIAGGGGMGGTPANPPGNISNGALGIFSAHTTERQRVVIP